MTQRVVYRAVHASGRIVRGTALAMPAHDLRQFLAAQQLELLETRPVHNFGGNVWPGTSRVTLPLWQNFFSALLWLLQAGVPLHDALGSMAQSANTLSTLCTNLQKKLNQGLSFTVALQAEKNIPPIIPLLIQSGDTTGQLPQALRSVLNYLDWEISHGHKLARQLAYPAFLLLVFLGVTCFLLGTVAPSVAQFLVDMGQTPPLPTQIILHLANQSYIFPALLALSLASAAMVRWGQKFLGIRRATEKFMTRIPLLGPCWRARHAGHIFLGLSHLLHHGYDFPLALHLLAQHSPSLVLRDDLHRLIQRIESGHSPAEAMSQELRLGPMAAQALHAAFSGNRVSEALAHLAHSETEQARQKMEQLVRWIEPALIIIIGALLILLISAVFMPLYGQLGNLR